MRKTLILVASLFLIFIIGYFTLDRIILIEVKETAVCTVREISERSSGADIVYERYITIDLYGTMARLPAERQEYCCTAINAQITVTTYRGYFTHRIYSYKLG